MLVSKPVNCDQSNKEPLKEASSLSSKLSTSSNIHLLHSLHVHHINRNKTKFQMYDECFPNQFHQPKEDQVPFLVKPTNSQRIEKKKNTTTYEPSHNEAINDPQSPHNNCT